MAPTPFAASYGTVGTFTIAGSQRVASNVEDGHLGYVAVVTLTPSSGSATELCARPAHMNGMAECNVAAAAVVRALKIALGV